VQFRPKQPLCKAEQVDSRAVRRHAGGSGLSDWTTIDFFGDESLVEDPYPYFDELRAECPVLPLDHLEVVAVTGYDEAHDVYRDTDTFSSCNSVVGPFVTFPVPLDGDDISAVIIRHRDQLPMHEHMVTMDPPQAHSGAGATDAADHTQAAQGQRGIHVAPGRPAARRIPGRGRLRIHECLRSAFRHARGR
jgi:hypothetical protein